MVPEQPFNLLFERNRMRRVQLYLDSPLDSVFAVAATKGKLVAVQKGFKDRLQLAKRRMASVTYSHYKGQLRGAGDKEERGLTGYGARS